MEEVMCNDMGVVEILLVEGVMCSGKAVVEI